MKNEIFQQKKHRFRFLNIFAESNWSGTKSLDIFLEVFIGSEVHNEQILCEPTKKKECVVKNVFFVSLL